MKTQKMYMFSIDYGLEEIDAFIKDNKIILVYGEKQYSFYINDEIIAHNKGEDVNYIYDCSLIDCSVDLPEVAWIFNKP